MHESQYVLKTISEICQMLAQGPRDGDEITFTNGPSNDEKIPFTTDDLANTLPVPLHKHEPQPIPVPMITPFSLHEHKSQPIQISVSPINFAQPISRPT